MLCEKFSESWFNGEHIVARRKLRPFCLWHYAYLHFVDSPLAPGVRAGLAGGGQAAKITWADIELASRVCQLSYMGRIGRIGPIRLRLFLTMAKSTIEKETAAFYAYVNDYFSPPEFNRWKSLASSIVRGSPPDPLSVASACIMMFGGGPATEKFVWEMPIGMAYWYSSTLHYNRGAPLDYITAQQKAIQALLRRLKREGKLKKPELKPEATMPAAAAIGMMKAMGKIR